MNDHDAASSARAARLGSAPFGDAVPFQNQRRWVGEESLAVALIGQ